MNVKDVFNINKCKKHQKQTSKSNAMKKVIFSMLIIICVFSFISCRNGKDENVITWQPKWEVGDSWTVKTIRKHQMSPHQEGRWTKLVITEYKIIGIEIITLLPFKLIFKKDNTYKNEKKEIEKEFGKEFKCYIIEAKTLITRGGEEFILIEKLYFSIKNFTFYRYETKALFIDYNFYSNEPVLIEMTDNLSHDMPYFPISLDSNKKFKKEFLVFKYRGKIDKKVKKYQNTNIESDWLSYINQKLPKVEKLSKNKLSWEDKQEYYRKEIISENKIYNNIKTPCYRVIFGRISDEGKRQEVTQIWSPGIPWWIYYESNYERSYLIEYSKSEK